MHFGSYVDAYCCSGKYFFDVHPPLGKLPVALVLKLGGYHGGQSFATLGTPLTHLDARLLRREAARCAVTRPSGCPCSNDKRGSTWRASWTGTSTYVEGQARKEQRPTVCYAVRDSLGQAGRLAIVDRGFQRALKRHAATFTLAEFAAVVGTTTTAWSM